MIFYILFIVFIIVITVECYVSYIYRNEKVNFKNILNKEECQDIINKVSKINFDITDENVSSHNCMNGHSVSLPLYEYDLDDPLKNVNNNLWENTVKPLYNKKLKPLINKLPWAKGKKIKLSWAFIKRYKKSERTHMRSHFDTNYFTFNILLSDKNDFKGGDFYIFDKYYSSKYRYIQHVDVEENDTIINQIGNDIPIVKDYEQGDILSFIGQEYLHGTLPVVEGERYVLVLFFNVE